MTCIIKTIVSYETLSLLLRTGALLIFLIAENCISMQSQCIVLKDSKQIDGD